MDTFPITPVSGTGAPERRVSPLIAEVMDPSFRESLGLAPVETFEPGALKRFGSAAVAAVQRTSLGAKLSDKLSNKISDTATVLAAEYLDPEDSVRRRSAFWLGASTQVADRARLMAFVMPPVFAESLDYGMRHELPVNAISGIAAVATGATFATWGNIVGKPFHAAVNEFPATRTAFVDNHPFAYRVVDKAAGGFVDDKDLSSYPIDTRDNSGGYRVGPYDAAKNRVGKALLGVKRSVAAGFTYGTTAYVGLGRTKNYSDTSTNRLRVATSLEGGGFWAAAAAVTSQVGLRGSPETAEKIKDVLSSRNTQLGIAAFGVAVPVVSNWYYRRKEKRLEQKANSMSQANPAETV